MQRDMSVAGGMELTDSFRALVTSTCEKLKGTDRRTFMADVAQQIGQRRAASEFGWGRDTIRKGRHERDSGIACVDALSPRGIKPLEQTRPKLIGDIRDIAESFAQTDPRFRTGERSRQHHLCYTKPVRCLESHAQPLRASPLQQPDSSIPTWSRYRGE